MNITQEIITPEMAREYLKFNTENYRSLSKDRVISYAGDMKNGEWQMNGEAIKFDETGKLIDGQHRLHAIIRAGVPVEMLVVRGVQESVNIYDIGFRRSLGQIAKARGIVPGWYSATMAVAGWIVNNGDSQHSYEGRATVLQYAEEHAEDITRAVRYCTIGKSSCICKRSAIISAVYCLIRTGVSQPEIGDFFRIANTGLPHGHNDPSPALIYRNMVQELNSSIQEERKLLFSAAVQAIRDFMAGKTRSMRYKFSMDAYELMHKVRLMDGLTEK